GGKGGTRIVGLTATRWGTLLESCADWPGPPPTASDCYRYCLAQPSVHVVLTAPRSLAELEQNSDVLELLPMSKRKRGQWQRFGDLVDGAGKGAFETSWPWSFREALPLNLARSGPPRLRAYRNSANLLRTHRPPQAGSIPPATLRPHRSVA